MFNFSNSSLTLVVANTIYQIIIVNNITQNMSQQVGTKYYIDLPFHVQEIVTTTKSPKKTKYHIK